MTKIDAFIFGIASIICCSSSNSNSVFQRFPSSYQRKVQDSLRKDWISIGKDIKGAVKKYGSQTKKSPID